MPHIVMEYSDGLANDDELNKLCKALYDTMCTFDCVRPTAMKIRAYPCKIAFYGNDADSFIHLTVHLLKGRSDKRKAEITKSLLDTLSQLLPQIHTISVDTAEIDPVTYQKNA